MSIKIILIFFRLLILAVVAVVGYILWVSYLDSPEYYQKQLTETSQKIIENPENAQNYYDRGLLIFRHAQVKGMNVYLGVKPSASQLLEAESDFAKASELDPNNNDFKLALASMRASRFSNDLKSIALFYTIEKHSGLPSNHQFNLPQWNEVFESEFESIEAANKWAEVVTSIKPLPDHLVHRGMLKFMIGKHEEGIDFLSQAIDLQLKRKINPEPGKIGTRFPQVVSDLLVRATCHLLLKNHEQALDDINKAVEVWPYYADVYIFRAYVKKYLQDTDGAIIDINKAIEQRPGWRGDYEKLIELYRN